MLNAETKKHIDSARNILVGVAPSPMTQVDLITTTLIYKFMDDMDQQSIKAGGNPKFFTGDLEKYSWSNLIDDRLDNQGKVNLYTEALTKFATSENLTPLFREVFKNISLTFKNPSTFKMFIDEINYFDYSHAEELGNAYEYLLTIFSVSKKAGQFRTPRHIIKFIVDIIDPKKDDKILDPACGTAGFLVEAFNHILEQHDEKNDPNNKEEPLTPEEKINLMNNIEGYDITPEMVRLSSVNLFLHGFKTPKIYEYDTLSSEEKWNDKFDIILANPPFMTPKGGIIPNSKYSIKAKKSEILFVDFILNHIKSNGKAGIVVPEGIIFLSNKSYIEIRKKLLDEGLYCVVSLPSGVFKPYSPVKTNILFIDKEVSKSRDEVLFVNIENDGFDLGAQRRIIDKNDIPKATEIINNWKYKKEEYSKEKLSIKKMVLYDDTEVSLNLNKYLNKSTQEHNGIKIASLGEIITLNFGERITKKNNKGTIYPVYGGGNESFRTNNYNRENEIIIARFALSKECVRYVKEKFWLLDSGATYSINQKYLDKVNKKFIGKVLLYIQDKIYSCARGGAQKNLDIKQFYNIKIPLPALKTQIDIINEIETYESIIIGNMELIEKSNQQIKEKIDSLWNKNE